MKTFALHCISISNLESLYWHPLPEFLKPVYDDIDAARAFRGIRFPGGFDFLHHQETLAVGAKIPHVSCSGKIFASKKLPGHTGFEYRFFASFCRQRVITSRTL